MTAEERVLLYAEKEITMTDYTSEAFAKSIAPFTFFECEGTYTLSVEAGDYLMELFATRADEGFMGNGYDIESLATVFLEEQFEGDAEEIEFDSEAGAFVAYCENGAVLADFALAFKKACEDAERIADLFSRAELL